MRRQFAASGSSVENWLNIMEFGTETDFAAAVKAYRPEIGKEELRELIMQFRAAVREHRGLS
jgi:hypothetical protein